MIYTALCNVSIVFIRQFYFTTFYIPFYDNYLFNF